MPGKTGERTRSDHIRVGDWEVERRLAVARVQGRGPVAVTRECGGYCCRQGVYISLRERSRILEHAGEVQGAMDETQTREIADWFEDEVHEDRDFEGGVCVGTAVHNDKCVFLDRDGLCVLQKIEPELDLPAGERLKPLYCRLFPVTTWFGKLEFDELCDGVRPCCTLAADGATRAIDAYAYELKEALGEEDFQSLKRYAEEMQERSEELEDQSEP